MPAINYDNHVAITRDIFWVGFYDEEANLHCNPYLLVDDNESVLIDPGSIPHFPIVARKVIDLINPKQISAIVLSHQDPDVCGNLAVMEDVIGRRDLKIVAHSNSLRLIRHYGLASEFYAVDEHDFTLTLASGRVLKFIFTPFLHSPGAIVTYDEKTRSLFSADIFGAVSRDWHIFATGSFTEPMAVFHQLYMPSNRILKHCLEQFESLALDRILPQHGSVLEGEQIRQGIAFLKSLPCGIDLLEGEMQDNIADLGARNLHDVQNINRELIEKALRMRCVSYLSQVKAKLLTETIYEIDSSKKNLQLNARELVKKQELIQRQKEELQKKNRELLDMRGLLEELVEERTAQLERTIDELKESEERYRAMFSDSNTAMLLINPDDGRIVDANEIAATYYGWTRRELQAMNIADINVLDEQAIIDEMDSARKEQRGHFQFRHRNAHDEIRDVEVHSSPVTLHGRHLLYSIVHDVTERKKTERALWESEETARALLNASTESAFLIDLRGRFIALNEVTARRLGKSVDELLGKQVFEYITAKSTGARRKILDQVIATGQPARMKDERDGMVLDNRLYPLFDSEGKVNRVAVFSRDISEQVHSEKRIAASLREKEVLLREVHHRVKNNLASIISLLSLQADQTSNPEIITALADCRDRIKSMALIHEKIYRSENFAQIELKGYVESLGKRLLLALNSSDGGVRLIYDLEDINLELDQAIPFGLILNELLTNAFKYAFPSGHGIIRVKVHRTDEREIELIVHDDGIGIHEHENIRDFESLGLSIVTNLTENQLEGILEFYNDNGACFIIRWPEDQNDGEEDDA